MGREAVAVKSVRSNDGTRIAFEHSGEGPPVILVGGALSSGLRSFPPIVELAEQLIGRFTAYRFDRRGRGNSTDTTPYAVQREVADLGALIAEAGGSAAVYGFSSGAVLAVEAAARGAAITGLVLLEPPLPSGDEGAGSQAELSELLAAGRRGDAVALFLSGVGLPPESIEGMRESPDWTALESMAHTMLYDGEITEDGGLWAERAASVSAPTLVLFSEGTSGYLGDSARVAADAIPGARLKILPGQFHEVAPETLAAELTSFLAGFIPVGGGVTERGAVAGEASGGSGLDPRTPPTAVGRAP
jgi:pimeloyl-ACP methyl ester carboxylesterase